jgi:Na+-driven multidrug efflux pump
LFPARLLLLFSAGAEMLEFGIPALRTIGIILVLPSVTLVVGYFCSGLGNGVVHMLGTLIRKLILFIPLAYLFAKTGEIGRVWYAMWISEAVAFVYVIWALRRELKRKVDPLCEK